MHSRLRQKASTDSQMVSKHKLYMCHYQLTDQIQEMILNHFTVLTLIVTC